MNEENIKHVYIDNTIMHKFLAGHRRSPVPLACRVSTCDPIPSPHLLLPLSVLPTLSLPPAPYGQLYVLCLLFPFPFQSDLLKDVYQALIKFVSFLTPRNLCTGDIFHFLLSPVHGLAFLLPGWVIVISKVPCDQTDWRTADPGAELDLTLCSNSANVLGKKIRAHIDLARIAGTDNRASIHLWKPGHQPGLSFRRVAPITCLPPDGR